MHPSTISLSQLSSHIRTHVENIPHDGKLIPAIHVDCRGINTHLVEVLLQIEQFRHQETPDNDTNGEYFLHVAEGQISGQKVHISARHPATKRDQFMDHLEHANMRAIVIICDAGNHITLIDGTHRGQVLERTLVPHIAPTVTLQGKTNNVYPFVAVAA